MKKKLICIITTILLCLSIYANYVQAYDTTSIEIDPDNLITLPTYIASSTVKATISSKAGTGYQFYYQPVFLTDAQYNIIENKGKDAETEITSMQNRINELQEAAENAASKYQEEYEKDPTSQATSDAKTAFDTASEEYENYVEECKEKVEAYQDELAASIPSFVESDWKQANDGTMNLDYADRSRTSSFCIMGKTNCK